MKIGIDGRFLAPRSSGNGVFTRMLVEHLARNEPGHRFVVYTNSDQNFLQQENFKLKKMNPLHRSPYLRFFFTFNQELKKNPVDVFHAIYTVPYNIPSKVVLSLIEFSWITEPELFPGNSLIRLQFSLMTRYGVRNADRIIVPTNYVRKRLLETFPVQEDKVEVIHLGVSSYFLERLSKKAIDQVLEKHSIRRPYLLFVGNLHPRKNVERLIQCFNMVREEDPSPLRLVLIGKRSPKYHQIHKWIVASPYREDIQVVGYASLSDLRAIYQGARLFVFPSLQEGFGIPPLEAMASNVPVAASSASSIPDVVGDAALLFDPFDIQDMKRAVLEILQSEANRTTLIEKGNTRVKQFFWDDLARKTLNVYESLGA